MTSDDGRSSMRDMLQLALVDQLLQRPDPDLTDSHARWMAETVSAIIEALRNAGYVVVERDRWMRVEAFAAASATIQRHKHDVFSRDKINLPEVEELNARLRPISAELDAAFAALHPGDLDPVGGED